MHINWATSVSFPDYPDPELQKDLRRRIADATDDDLLAAFLHWTEGRIAAELSRAANDLEDEVARELQHLDALRKPLGTLFSMRYLKAHGTLRDAIYQACDASGTAASEARMVCDQLRKLTTGNLSGHYQTGTNHEQAPAGRLGSVMDQLGRIESELRSALRVHRDAMHDVALREQDLKSFIASEDSVAVEDIHAMSPAMFEQTVAALARRDGHTILRSSGGSRDLGADVITMAPDGSRVVLQCKHRQGGRGKVGSPDVQTLNGTARPEHKADIVIAVTNGTFTKPAVDFARNHDISLLDCSRLRRWATWGEPLLSVVGIGEAGRKDVSTGWWSPA
ncbi:restriction endonuclease [Streptomyces sp. NPDC015232]|uniref:restriction endonuclease n=1 Tax=unclassified Streptomyces TaxID=2593676 RepID=UPI0037027CC3